MDLSLAKLQTARQDEKEFADRFNFKLIVDVFKEAWTQKIEQFQSFITRGRSYKGIGIYKHWNIPYRATWLHTEYDGKDCFDFKLANNGFIYDLLRSKEPQHLIIRHKDKQWQSIDKSYYQE